MSVPAIANWLHDSVVSVFIDNMLWQALHFSPLGLQSTRRCCQHLMAVWPALSIPCWTEQSCCTFIAIVCGPLSVFCFFTLVFCIPLGSFGHSLRICISMQQDSLAGPHV